jgi:Na+-transporting NADH:ubiquinone oxidoreductase subunit NqrC
MKWPCLFLVALTLSCGLFKKTSKTTVSDKQLLTREIEQNQLILKSANKETQVFTYWNDSGFYQFQNIKEQINQAKSGQFKTQEKQKVEQETTVKKSEPVKMWIYAGAVAIVALAIYLSVIFFKLKTSWN